MKYQVIAINVDGEYVGYSDDIFDTEEEAGTFIGIESTQIEMDAVEKFIIVKLIEKGE
jgi:hypothetical protein